MALKQKYNPELTVIVFGLDFFNGLRILLRIGFNQLLHCIGRLFFNLGKLLYELLLGISLSFM